MDSLIHSFSSPFQGWDLEVRRMRCPGQNCRRHLLSGCFRCRTSPESEHFLKVCPLAASTSAPQHLSLSNSVISVASKWLDSPGAGRSHRFSRVPDSGLNSQAEPHVPFVSEPSEAVHPTPTRHAPSHMDSPRGPRWCLGQTELLFSGDGS